MTDTHPGPVVVGVSPTTGSPAALRWAAEYAALRDAQLVAVLAWRPARAPGAAGARPPSALLSPDRPDPEGTAVDKLRSFVERALGDAGKIDCRAVRGSAVSALLASGADAQLLVIGEPRPGRLASVRASLVAPQLVLRSRCPVVVLPALPSIG